MGIKHLNKYLQNNCHDGIKKIPFYELSGKKIAIAPVILVLVFLGFYPKPVLSVINPTTQTVMTHAGVSDPIAKVAK